MTSISDNKTLFRKYAELLETPGRLEEVVSANSVSHDRPAGLPAGIEGLTKFQRAVMAAFPDQSSEIRDIVG